MFDTSPEYVSSNGSPTSFMTTSPPIHQVQYSPQQEFRPLQGSPFLHWSNSRPFSNLFMISMFFDLNIIWSLKRGDSIQISALFPRFSVSFPLIWSCTNWPALSARPMHWFLSNYVLLVFLQFTNFLSNYLERWQERCRWQPRGGGDPDDPRNDLSLSASNWHHSFWHSTPWKIPEKWPPT